MNAKPNIRVVSATEAKNHFGDIIKSAYLRDEHLIVKRDGIPVVAIVPIADYRRLLNLRELDNELSEDSMRYASDDTSKEEQQLTRMSLSEFLEAIHERIGEVDEEEVERDIQEAIQAVRAEQRLLRAGTGAISTN